MPRIAVIPGDGIGPEVIAEGQRALTRLAELDGFELELAHFDFGAERYLKDGTTLPDEALAHLRDDFDAILLGALGDPRIPDMRHGREILLRLRFDLDLFINLRPITLYDPRYTPLKEKAPADIDFVVFRENTEGLYVGVGGNFKEGTADEVAITESINTRKGVERIQRAALEHARTNGLKRVCMSDKSNAMPHAGGLWRRVWNELAAEYDDLELSHRYVDVLAMELVAVPERYDVIVTSNLFGDILSDLGAGLVGGLGLAASANLHPGQVGLFEPVHGSAPDIAGQGVANPLATMVTVRLMLQTLGQNVSADRLDRAVRKALATGKVTRELGGDLSTTDVGDFILEALNEDKEQNP